MLLHPYYVCVHACVCVHIIVFKSMEIQLYLKQNCKFEELIGFLRKALDRSPLSEEESKSLLVIARLLCV